MLKPNPNLPGKLLEISEAFHGSAIYLTGQVQDGPELTAGLRKLLEAKDCFVRQALVDSRVSE